MRDLVTPAGGTAVIGALVSALTWLTSRRKLATEVRRADVDTAGRVAELVEQHYGAVIAQQTASIEALRTEAEQLRVEIDRIRQDATTAHSEAERLRRRVAVLEEALRAAGLAIPPEDDWR